MALTSDFNPNVAVPFSRMRYMMSESGGGLQAGVVGASDFMVVQRGAGANMSVDVGTGGAWVAITTGTRNGLAHCFNDAVANVTITAAHATLPRIDQIYLRYNDSSIPTGSGDVPTLAVGTGTATSGATLANRTGALALPTDTLRLADILVAATDTSITNTEIRDRRPWARGAFARIAKTVDTTTTSTSLTPVDAGLLTPRIECSGTSQVRCVLTAGAIRSTSAAAQVNIDIASDSVTAGNAVAYGGTGYPANMNFGPCIVWVISVAAGSHLIAPYWSTSAGTATMSGASGFPTVLMVEELVRPNTANNTVTSG